MFQGRRDVPGQGGCSGAGWMLRWDPSAPHTLPGTLSPLWPALALSPDVRFHIWNRPPSCSSWPAARPDLCLCPRTRSGLGWGIWAALPHQAEPPTWGQHCPQPHQLPQDKTAAIFSLLSLLLIILLLLFLAAGETPALALPSAPDRVFPVLPARNFVNKGKIKPAPRSHAPPSHSWGDPCPPYVSYNGDTGTSCSVSAHVSPPHHPSLSAGSLPHGPSPCPG